MTKVNRCSLQSTQANQRSGGGTCLCANGLCPVGTLMRKSEQQRDPSDCEGWGWGAGYTLTLGPWGHAQAGVEGNHLTTQGN